jgi:hypothetical protein
MNNNEGLCESLPILGFQYLVNLTGGQPQMYCIDAYAVLEWENDTKFHVFATKYKANT